LVNSRVLLKEQTVDHVRIAVYDVIRGTAEEAIEITHAPGGMADIFKAQPGFQAYSIIEVDPVTTVSLSFWATHEEADHAVAEAADWVQSNLADRLRRNSNYVGDTRFWIQS
jgi:heme-degrading monooxygenase HmoA